MVNQMIVKHGKTKVIVKKGSFNSTKQGIAKTMQVLGFGGSAKQIRKAKTASRVEREVLYQLGNELKRGRGGKYLYDPVTRKRKSNPMRSRWLEIAKRLVIAVKILKAAEKMR